jgi:hypothetical protein
MEREECDCTTSRTSVALSLKKTTTIWRRAPEIKIVNPGPRSSPLHRAEAVPKLEMVVKT